MLRFSLRSISSFPCRRELSYSASFKSSLVSELSAMKESGTYKVERVISSSQDTHITVVGSQKPLLNFCANNYLGLANDKALINAAKKTLDSHGLGLSSVRFICGTQDIHKRLESLISQFHGCDDSILYPSCFDANAALFEALFGPEDAIISDTLNHASIIDGVRLCKARRYRFKHMDMSDLEKNLIEARLQRHRIIATDGVFSMDGDIAPLADICALAEKHDALVFVDECHATGFFGKSGRGTPEYAEVEGRIDIINSTLGKALGGATGGYTTARQEVVDVLRQRARPYLFSNAVAPAVVGAAIATFELLMHSSELVEKLAINTQHFRRRMTQAGFTLAGASEHAIAPVMLYDARLALRFADLMLDRGIYVIAFSFPVVPREQARIRVQLSAAHSLEDVDTAVDAFVQVGEQLGVIESEKNTPNQD